MRKDWEMRDMNGENIGKVYPDIRRHSSLPYQLVQTRVSVSVYYRFRRLLVSFLGD